MPIECYEDPIVTLLKGLTFKELSRSVRRSFWRTILKEITVRSDKFQTFCDIHSPFAMSQR